MLCLKERDCWRQADQRTNFVKDGKTIKTQLLRPLTAHKDEDVLNEAGANDKKRPDVANANEIRSTVPSPNGHTSIDDGGVILNANREVRVKLYMGRVRSYAYLAEVQRCGAKCFLITLTYIGVYECRYLWDGSGSSRRSTCRIHALP